MLQDSKIPLSVAVAINHKYKTLSETLANRLSLPLLDQAVTSEKAENNFSSTYGSFNFILRYEKDKSNGTPCLMLTATAGNFGNAITVDFCSGKTQHRHRYGGGRGQPLAKAVGLKGGENPTVVDVTAGLGKDAFVIASLGAKVTLLERSPVLAALLEDGLGRASQDSDIKKIITHNMKLVSDDAIEWLDNLPKDQHPDVIYMDPMYPHRSKSALVKKEMRVLRELVGEDEDASQLLHAALSCAKQRVAVKRPRTALELNGSILNNRKPNSTVESKNTRYDIYVP